MKNIVLFHVGRVRVYQLKCAMLLTCVPLLCSVSLAAILFFFAQQNLYFLENAGLIINDAIRQAYQDQVILELIDVLWLLVALFSFTFISSFMLVGWAISPFVNAEKVLRSALADPSKHQDENDWLSESPSFHKVIWGLSQRLKDKNYAFDNIEEPQYRFGLRFFFKFALSFYAISLATGFILGTILNTVYVKIVSLAISLVKMSQRGHYFLAQEELLQIGTMLMVVLSCIVYVIIGYYLTRYMSNMLFVFTRAIKEHHFPLKLRESDIYHDLADAITQVAEKCGLSRGLKNKSETN